MGAGSSTPIFSDDDNDSVEHAASSSSVPVTISKELKIPVIPERKYEFEVDITVNTNITDSSKIDEYEALVKKMCFSLIQKHKLSEDSGVDILLVINSSEYSRNLKSQTEFYTRAISDIDSYSQNKHYLILVIEKGFNSPLIPKTPLFEKCESLLSDLSNKIFISVSSVDITVLEKELTFFLNFYLVLLLLDIDVYSTDTGNARIYNIEIDKTTTKFQNENKSALHLMRLFHDIIMGPGIPQVIWVNYFNSLILTMLTLKAIRLPRTIFTAMGILRLWAPWVPLIYDKGLENDGSIINAMDFIVTGENVKDSNFIQLLVKKMMTVARSLLVEGDETENTGNPRDLYIFGETLMKHPIGSYRFRVTDNDFMTPKRITGSSGKNKIIRFAAATDLSLAEEIVSSLSSSLSTIAFIDKRFEQTLVYSQDRDAPFIGILGLMPSRQKVELNVIESIPEFNESSIDLLSTIQKQMSKRAVITQEFITSQSCPIIDQTNNFEIMIPSAPGLDFLQNVTTKIFPLPHELKVLYFSPTLPFLSVPPRWIESSSIKKNSLFLYPLLYEGKTLNDNNDGKSISVFVIPAGGNPEERRDYDLINDNCTRIPLFILREEVLKSIEFFLTEIIEKCSPYTQRHKDYQQNLESLLEVSSEKIKNVGVRCMIAVNNCYLAHLIHHLYGVAFLTEKGLLMVRVFNKLEKGNSTGLVSLDYGTIPEDITPDELHKIIIGGIKQNQPLPVTKKEISKTEEEFGIAYSQRVLRLKCVSPYQFSSIFGGDLLVAPKTSKKFSGYKRQFLGHFPVSGMGWIRDSPRIVSEPTGRLFNSLVYEKMDEVLLGSLDASVEEFSEWAQRERGPEKSPYFCTSSEKYREFLKEISKPSLHGIVILVSVSEDPNYDSQITLNTSFPNGMRRYNSNLIFLTMKLPKLQNQSEYVCEIMGRLTFLEKYVFKFIESLEETKENVVLENENIKFIRVWFSPVIQLLLTACNIKRKSSGYVTILQGNPFNPVQMENTIDLLILGDLLPNVPEIVKNGYMFPINNPYGLSTSGLREIFSKSLTYSLKTTNGDDLEKSLFGDFTSVLSLFDSSLFPEFLSNSSDPERIKDVKIKCSNCDWVSILDNLDVIIKCPVCGTVGMEFSGASVIEPETLFEFRESAVALVDGDLEPEYIDDKRLKYGISFLDYLIDNTKSPFNERSILRVILKDLSVISKYLFYSINKDLVNQSIKFVALEIEDSQKDLLDWAYSRNSASSKTLESPRILINPLVNDWNLVLNGGVIDRLVNGKSSNTRDKSFINGIPELLNRSASKKWAQKFIFRIVESDDPKYNEIIEIAKCELELVLSLANYESRLQHILFSPTEEIKDSVMFWISINEETDEWVWIRHLDSEEGIATYNSLDYDESSDNLTQEFLRFLAHMLHFPADSTPATTTFLF